MTDNTCNCNIKREAQGGEIKGPHVSAEEHRWSAAHPTPLDEPTGAVRKRTAPHPPLREGLGGPEIQTLKQCESHRLSWRKSGLGAKMATQPEIKPSTTRIV
eukprot:880408-Amphidinium_carterae.1